MVEQKYVRRDPEGPLVAGQVIHVRVGFLHLRASIERIVQAEPPVIGQTVYARVSFLGKDGESVSSWTRDSEHYHFQTRSEVNHPWYECREYTKIRCLALDATSCVVYIEQSEMTFRLLPRWLVYRLNHSGEVEKGTTGVIEASLQRIKVKAE
jgi:hypothetical protein